MNEETEKVLWEDFIKDIEKMNLTITKARKTFEDALNLGLKEVWPEMLDGYELRFVKVGDDK